MKEYLDFPVIEVKGILYIEVQKWTDAKAIRELFNSDPSVNSNYSAQFPVHMQDGNNPFDGFKLDYYYIHLSPKFYNTNR